jgi:hypothetical protein
MLARHVGITPAPGSPGATVRKTSIGPVQQFFIAADVTVQTTEQVRTQLWASLSWMGVLFISDITLY